MNISLKPQMLTDTNITFTRLQLHFKNPGYQVMFSSVGALCNLKTPTQKQSLLQNKGFTCRMIDGTQY